MILHIVAVGPPRSKSRCDVKQKWHSPILTLVSSHVRTNSKRDGDILPPCSCMPATSIHLADSLHSLQIMRYFRKCWVCRTWSVRQRYSTLHAMAEALRSEKAELPSESFPPKRFQIPFVSAAPYPTTTYFVAARTIPNIVRSRVEDDQWRCNCQSVLE